jgi:hypothetical protein
MEGKTNFKDRTVARLRLCRRIRVWTLLLIAVGACLTVVVLATGLTRSVAAARSALSRADKPSTITAGRGSSGLASQASTGTSQGPPSHVQPGGLWPEFRMILRTLGNRFSVPGKERWVLTGTMATSGGTQHPFQLTVQLPNLMYLQQTVNGSTQVMVFNGQQAQKLGGSIGQQDQDVIETIMYDTIGHILLGHATGTVAIRQLGGQFRLDDGTTTAYSGGYYDLFQIMDRVAIGPEIVQRTKTLYVNSSTLMPEQIHYTMSANGSDTNVQVQDLSWQKTGDQMFPYSIQRTENGQTVLQMNIINIAYGPAGDTTIFNQP